MDCITSAQNPLIKHLCKLREKPQYRKTSGCFLVEGVREIRLAILAAYEIETLVVGKGIIAQDTAAKIINENQPCKTFFVSSALYKKVAVRGNSEGVLGVFKYRSISLKGFVFKRKKPLVLVAETLEKPGNVGGILRTADALGLDAVLLADTRIDIYNPQLIRASLGGIFTVPIIAENTQNIQAFLSEKGFQIYAAALTANSENYTRADFTKSTAIVLGAESAGLSNAWLENDAVQKIQIPMRGKIDSMNVSVAAGIMISEAVRQRSF